MNDLSVATPGGAVGAAAGSVVASAPDALTLDERHAHEAEVYDRMGRELLESLDDAALLVDPFRIPFPNREHVDYLSHAVSSLGALKGARVLEIGVGGGALTVYLAQQGAQVTGIDVSGGMLELARRRVAVNGVENGVRLVHSPVEDFEAEPFDAILANNVLHHLDLTAGLPKIRSLLAPNGVAAFCEPVLFVPEWVRAARYSRAVSRVFPPHTHTPDERSLDRAALRLVAEEFPDMSWRPFHVLCRLQHFVELSDPWWNRLERVDRRLLRHVRPTRWVCRQIVLTFSNTKRGIR